MKLRFNLKYIYSLSKIYNVSLWSSNLIHFAIGSFIYLNLNLRENQLSAFVTSPNNKYKSIATKLSLQYWRLKYSVSKL